MDGDIERAATNDVDQSKWRSIEIDIYPQPPADPDEDIDRCVNNLNRSTKPHLLRPLVPASSPSKTERPKFSLTLAEAFESPVIRNMFNSTEPFLEAIEYKIELPTVTNYAMGAIVQFLRTRMLPEINDLGLVAEVLMASEFLQLQSLQQWCFPIIAKQSMDLRSFGDLPCHLIKGILMHMDAAQLCAAEEMLYSDDRHKEIDFSTLWINAWQRQCHESQTNSDEEAGKNLNCDALFARLQCIGAMLQNLLSYHVPPKPAQQLTPRFSYRPGATIKGAYASSALQDTPEVSLLKRQVHLLAPNVHSLRLRNSYLDDDILYFTLSRLNEASEIDLSGNRFGGNSGQAIARALRGLEPIVDLNLRGCGLTALSARAVSITKDSRSSRTSVPGLRPVSHSKATSASRQRKAMNSPMRPGHSLRVNLSGNSVGDQIILTLKERLYCMRRLDISDNELGIRGAQFLAMAFGGSLKNLKMLFANSCDFEGMGIATIAASLCTNNEVSLQTLHLGGNITRVDGARACSQLAKLLTISPSLQDLNISENAFSLHGLVDLAEAIKTSNVLEILTMERIPLEKVISNFALAFQRSESLFSINISGSCLPPIGTVKFASVLAYNSNLKRLNISGCELNDDVVISIADSLSYNESLETFILNGCEASPKLTGDLVHKLSLGMARHATIECVSLAFQRLRNSGLAAIAQCIRRCANMKHVDVRDNWIGSRGVLDMIAMLSAAHESLIDRDLVIDMRHNDFGVEVSDAVMKLSETLPLSRILIDEP